MFRMKKIIQGQSAPICQRKWFELDGHFIL